MKEILGVKSDVELTKYLNIKGNGVVSTWKTRGKIPYKECDYISQKTGASFEWLLSGDGARYVTIPKDEHSPTKKIIIKEAIGYTLGLQSSKHGVCARVILESYDIVSIVKAIKDDNKDDNKYTAVIDSFIEQLENKPMLECEISIDFGSNNILLRSRYDTLNQ